MEALVVTAALAASAIVALGVQKALLSLLFRVVLVGPGLPARRRASARRTP